MPYSISITPSGHTLSVLQGETILDAALNQGIALPYGCRSGNCGACQGKVLRGDFYYEEEPLRLTDQEREQGYALFCQAIPRSDMQIEIKEIDTISEVEVRKLTCKVARLERLNHDVMRMLIKLPDQERLQFFAGQYLDFIQDDGERRSFSIANAPHDDAYIELHIRHVEGGEFTRYIFEDMKEKEIVRIEAPLGSFFLREESVRPIILMGGGTGFAPLKGMLEHAFHIGIDRPIHLFWGVRALRDIYLADLPRQWEEQYPNFRYTPVLSEPQAGDNWQGETGFVHDAVLREYPLLNDFELYMSGPPVMIEIARVAFLQRGIPEEYMYSDAFEFNSLIGKSGA